MNPIYATVQHLFNHVPAVALATTSEDHSPHVVAIASKIMHDDGTIRVIDHFLGETKKHFLTDIRVSLAVRENLVGYQIKGDAIYHADGDVFEKAHARIRSIHPDRPVHGVCHISINEILSLIPGTTEKEKKVWQYNKKNSDIKHIGV